MLVNAFPWNMYWNKWILTTQNIKYFDTLTAISTVGTGE